MNLTILRELDAKHQVADEHPLGEHIKPLVNEVTGLQTEGVMSLVDIFRGFMSNQSQLTQPLMTISRNSAGANQLDILWRTRVSDI